LKPEIYSLRNRPPLPREGTKTNFVSTLGLEPEPFLLITGTFNLFVKEPNRLPPERCAFSPEQIHTVMNLSVLETF
jgi:hypothetical protein